MSDDLRQRLNGCGGSAYSAGHSIPRRRRSKPQQLPPPAQGPLTPGEAVLRPRRSLGCHHRYPLAEHPDLAAVGHQPSALRCAGPERDALRLQPPRAAFIDTETTGLCSARHVYFLIGIGTCELTPEPAFVVRQYFMRNPQKSAASSIWSRRR